MTSQQRESCLLPPWPRTSTRSEHGGTAEHSLGDALAIAETAYGPEHPDVGTALNNLATILRGLGELAAARPLAEPRPGRVRRPEAWSSLPISGSTYGTDVVVRSVVNRLCAAQNQRHGRQ